MPALVAADMPDLQGFAGEPLSPFNSSRATTGRRMAGSEGSFADYSRKCSASKVEAVAEDHLGDQVIGRGSDADPQTKVNFPFRRKVQVDGRENLVHLLA